VRPKLSVVSDRNNFLKSLVDCIGGIECSQFFSSHLGKSQTDQKLLVSGFQALVMSALASSIQDVEWSVEYCPSPKNRDSIDIFGKGAGFVVVIELDKSRADQVAKKFVSRMALLPSIKVYYVSLCYPGTENMNKSECEKYFGYCSALALRMDSHYAGFIVEPA
jgi:hypothetical protein